MFWGSVVFCIVRKSSVLRFCCILRKSSVLGFCCILKLAVSMTFPIPKTRILLLLTGTEFQRKIVAIIRIILDHGA